MTDKADPSLGSDLKAAMKRTFIPVLVPLVIMWVMFLFFMIFGNQFNRTLALEARTVSGLSGILFMPLLHGGIWHLISNTMSWLVLGGMTSMLTKRFTSVMLSLWLLSGAILWVIGTPWHPGSVGYHVGASAVIYGFAAFIITYAILARRFLAMIFGIFVAFAYGISMLMNLIPGTQGISWTGHLAGAIAGVLVAFILTKEAGEVRAQKKAPKAAAAPAVEAKPNRRRSSSKKNDESDDGMDIDYSKYIE